jgi:hypothetical protein
MSKTRTKDHPRRAWHRAERIRVNREWRSERREEAR